MPHNRRNSAPKVRGGKVQRKNRSARTPTIYNTRQSYPAFDKERPGRGYKHVVRKKGLYAFIDILPQWDELAVGLDVVLLGKGRCDCMGWRRPGIVAICAWDRDIEWDDDWEGVCTEHEALLDNLGVVFYPQEDKGWHVGWTESTAQAFQLIHVFVHELGRHHDKMTTRSKRGAARGESYAEAYARKWEDTMLERYFEVFGMP
jgi:hypothetical protein